MAGLAHALSITGDQEACRRLCAEVLGSRRWGPAEQRVLLERLPFLMQRLHAWFGLGNAGLEEALLRTFHPTGPLSAHLATMETPSFVFPLQKLPPRTLKAALLACGGGRPQLRLAPDGRRVAAAALCDPNPLFDMLGPGRLARVAGHPDGVTLTAQEFVLTTLVYFLVSEPPPPTKGLGSGGASATPAGGVQPQTTTGATSSSSSGSRSSRQPGALSSAYERLLLAYLQAHLPHRQYDVGWTQESRASTFFTRLLHEFLLAPQPLGANSVAPSAADPRLQASALHACRLAVLHILANPCLRQGCEETAERMMRVYQAKNELSFAAGCNARITREMWLLGPAAIQMVCELLVKLQSQKEVGLEAVTSLTKLWLIFLQPWKAPRLYEWYLSLRPADVRLEPPTTSTAKTTRPVDVALLGMEPETTGEPPVPLVPKEVQEEGLSSVSTSTRLAAAAGLTSAGLALAASTAATAQLVPGEGDPCSWRNYVRGFQGAYLLLEALLSTPLHTELCLELVRHGAGWDRGEGLFANVGLTAARPSAAGNWGNTPSPTAVQLLRQRHAIQALKALGQALLCFDGQLLQILQDLPADCGQWLAERGLPFAAPMQPIFEGSSLRPELMRAVSITWAALLSAASVVELQPLLAAVSRQLQHASQWLPGRFPALEDTNKHRPFAQSVLQEIGAAASLLDASMPPPAPAVPAPAPVQTLPNVEFTGSEWQRPVRGGEFEPLLCLAYRLANLIDQSLGRGPILTECGPVPQTEWPRMFANWKLFLFVNILLLLAIWW